MKNNFLFRGVNLNIHQQGKALQPKCQTPFEYGSKYGEATYNTGWAYGKCDRNAVIKHQLNQESFPTSGISTTPLYERAVMYATSGANGVHYEKGYVYKIDRERFQSYNVKEYIVAEYTTTPSIPEDQEVILVVAGGGALSKEVILDIIEVVGIAA